MKMSGREISALFLEHCSFSSVRLKKKIKISIVEKKIAGSQRKSLEGQERLESCVLWAFVLSHWFEELRNKTKYKEGKQGER